MSSKGNSWRSGGSIDCFCTFTSSLDGVKVAQKLKIKIKSDKSTQFAPNPTDDQKTKKKKNMLSIYSTKRTLVYKSEKTKLVHCSKCIQTQTYIDRPLCGWRLCKHLLSLPVLGSLLGVPAQLSGWKGGINPNTLKLPVNVCWKHVSVLVQQI